MRISPGKTVDVISGIMGVLLPNIALFLMMLITVADITGRKMLNRPLPGATEAAVSLLVIAVYFGLVKSKALRDHVRIELLLSRFPPGVQVAFNLFALVVVLTLVALLVWKTGVVGIESWRIGEYQQGGIKFPIWPVRMAVPIGSAMFGIVVLTEALEQVRKIGRRKE